MPRSVLPSASAGSTRLRVKRGAALLAAGAVLASGAALGSGVGVASADDAAADQCGGIVAADRTVSRQINLVLDDSGSMFQDFRTKSALTRWSHAKYSLGVFAALMGPGDTLNVYRLSDFSGRQPSETAVLSLSGSDSPLLNVERIDAMEMVGRETPFAAVTGAFNDLKESNADEKWLVVLTDGKFQEQGSAGQNREIEQAELRQRIQSFAAEAADDNIQIAYLALGADIPTVESQPKRGIYGEQARDTDALLGRVEKFANQIFGRDELPASVFVSNSPPVADIDVDMNEMIVFAQGPNVDIGALQTDDGTREPSTSVQVQWTPNPFQVLRRGQPIPSVPDEGLQGQVKYFDAIPKGRVGFSIANTRSDTPTVFYRPNVRLGYELRDEDGRPIRSNAVEAGDYAVFYGFQDANCNFVDSRLLGDVEYLGSSISVGGNLVAADFASGDVISFPEGEADIAIAASYLQGTRVAGLYTQTFLKPALQSSMRATAPTYLVSEMAEFQSDQDAIRLEYTIVEDGVSRLPDADEWAALDPQSFEIESASNLDFDLKKLDEPGQLLLRARAPDGDVFAASTGPIEATVRGSYVSNRSDLYAEETVQFEVEDDLSTWDRFKNWFANTGWKLLLALLALALLLGYLFKRRFSKRIKKKPEINGTPRTVGMTAIQDRGKFEVNGLRRLLPFVANTATLSYVPAGTAGFKKLKLKAGPSKSMIVTNWKEIAERDNVEINGTPLNAETKRPPRVGPASTITAATPQMTYDLTPNI